MPGYAGFVPGVHAKNMFGATLQIIYYRFTSILCIY